MRNDGLTRPKWVEHQYLRPQDFVAEQNYHIVNRWRHNVGLHGWGIVDGLDIALIDGSPVVLPGMAIDGYGRELILTTGWPIPVVNYDGLGTDALHVWIHWRRIEIDVPTNGHRDCLDAGEPAGNWYEAALLFTTDGRQSIDPRDGPRTVPESDLPFPPFAAFPTESDAWAVYLGTVTRDQGSDPPYQIDGRQRPYAGIVAATVEHPTGAAHIQLGGEPNDRVRFSISTVDDLGTTTLRPRVELIEDLEPTLVFRDSTIVDGDISIARGAVRFENARLARSEPVTAHPSQIYRFDERGNSTLRIEFGDGTHDRLEIGKWDSDAQQFKACLTIDADCNVTIAGDLIVEGTLMPQGGVSATDLSPEAERLRDMYATTQLATLSGDLLPGMLGFALAKLAGREG